VKHPGPFSVSCVPSSAAFTGWARIRGGYDDRFQGGMLGLSLGW
jgi:hypothetical protein